MPMGEGNLRFLHHDAYDVGLTLTPQNWYEAAVDDCVTKKLYISSCCRASMLHTRG
jgi:hypothetical protein